LASAHFEIGSTVNQFGTYGTQGVPDVGNTPGARRSAVSWIDGSGAAWLFGGYDDGGGNEATLLGDLWRLTGFTPTVSVIGAWRRYE